MKLTKTHHKVRNTALAIGASYLLTSIPAHAVATEKSFGEKMEQWQNDLSAKFHDTWKNLRGTGDNSVSTAAVDLREDRDNYTIRLNLPNRDLAKVDIRLVDDSLRIVAPADEKAGRYEQTVALAHADPTVPPKIERRQKEDLIVVTIPKDRGVAMTAPPSDSMTTPLTDWDRDILSRMNRMRREMDRMFEDSFAGFPSEPEMRGFFNTPRFGSTVDLKTEGDNYVVRAYLPERNMKNVKVSVEGQTLKIEARSEDVTKKEGEKTTISHQAEYSQLLSLPGPVQIDKMKVDKMEEMLVVTLPKA